MSQNLAKSLLKLTAKERIFVESRLAGLTQVAAAAAAGYAHPKTRGSELDAKPNVQAAMLEAMNDIAEEVGFTRKEAHDMLMQAYQNAATAGEQIQAVKEMINLHGLAVPKQIEHKHTHDGTISLERMETRDLLELAGMDDFILEGEFTDVTDDNGRKSLSKL